jgi:hypothetical protein
MSFFAVRKLIFAIRFLLTTLNEMATPVHTHLSNILNPHQKKVLATSILASCCLLFIPYFLLAQSSLSHYNITWNSQSKNSGESMPCGGGDIGLNVWVENGDLLLYVARTGSFDENNALLKTGRIRLQLAPNPFSGDDFKQQLLLNEGYVKINANNNGVKTEINVWVDVFNPVIHVDVHANKPVKAVATFESWRYKDRPSLGRSNNGNSYKWAPQGDVTTFRDSIAFRQNKVVFFHRNRDFSVFDVTVKQQALEAVKDQLFNPLKNLTFGGMMEGIDMMAAGTTSGSYLDSDYHGWKLASRKAKRSHSLNIYLHTSRSTLLTEWESALTASANDIKARQSSAWSNTKKWWKTFWERSYIFVHPQRPDEHKDIWQVGRNYQLFRYMLACNARGAYPTKFNGGLFTYDPSLTDSTAKFTPDHRNWGGGTHTAQNQRLVYFPMLKSGDFDMMKPQLDFYVNLQKNAELRTKIYWDHAGACFTEQLENFGLPNPAEYGWNRPPLFDKGVEYNAWLEYHWDTVLEFCLMMLETDRYQRTLDSGQRTAGKPYEVTTAYIPFIESCLRFFDEHYQYLSKLRGRRPLDGNNQLVLYPGSGAETYKMAYNSNSTIAALSTVTSRLLELPPGYLADEKRKYFTDMLKRIPPLNFREMNGSVMLSPAKLWERVNHSETPQLYPVFPWGIYGVGRPGLDTAINTWTYDTSAVKARSHVGWRQDNIFAARLGLTEDATRLNVLKVKNSGRRFPAFWGPGYDWTPDHNWGGSGMIGLQEMLMQTHEEKIYLFPAWPAGEDVHFKLHAPYETTVEASLKNGKIVLLKVTPESRRKDVVMMLK